MLTHLLHWLYQQGECELCFARTTQSGFLCATCYTSLPKTQFACSQCAEPLMESGRCNRCVIQTPACDYAFCNFLYSPPISQWLLGLKDQKSTQHLAQLEWLLTHKPPFLINVDAITYIPSTPTSFVKRGFNPAEFLAEAAAKTLNLPLLHNVLYKQSGIDQRLLNRQSRIKNMEQSLTAGSIDLTNQHILLVDDVITTGATINAAAKALKNAGAKTVGAWALARTTVSI